jgi:hypothetical protein
MSHDVCVRKTGEKNHHVILLILRHLVRPDRNTLEYVVTPLYLGPLVHVIRDYLNS